MGISTNLPSSCVSRTRSRTPTISKSATNSNSSSIFSSEIYPNTTVSCKATSLKNGSATQITSIEFPTTKPKGEQSCFSFTNNSIHNPQHRCRKHSINLNKREKLEEINSLQFVRKRFGEISYLCRSSWINGGSKRNWCQSRRSRKII